MRKIDDEIQALLSEHRGDIRSILKDNHRLDLLYALSSQRELLLEWYDFEPEAEVLQVGADYGALTGLLRSSVSAVTVLDETESALERCASAIRAQPTSITERTVWPVTRQRPVRRAKSMTM